MMVRRLFRFALLLAIYATLFSISASPALSLKDVVQVVPDSEDIPTNSSGTWSAPDRESKQEATGPTVKAMKDVPWIVSPSGKLIWAYVILDVIL